MRSVRTGPLAFTVEFESEAELAAEARTNLSAGGLRLPTPERLPVFTRLSLLVRLAGAGEAAATATVVAPLPDGVALAVENGKFYTPRNLESILRQSAVYATAALGMMPRRPHRASDVDSTRSTAVPQSTSRGDLIPMAAPAPAGRNAWRSGR